MFKKRSISNFIEQYEWELEENEFFELQVFLNKIPRFTSIIRKINKLPKKEKDYVLETINNYKKYRFKPEQVELLLNDKLNIIKNNHKLLNLDRLYYAFNCDDRVYNSFITDYDNSKNQLSTTISIASYYEIINKYYRDFHILFKDSLTTKDSPYEFNKYLFSLTPRFLSSFFEFAKENKLSISIQKRFLNIIAENNLYFENLSIMEFYAILDFAFKCEDETNQRDVLDRKIKMIMYFKDEIKNDLNYLNALGNLPDDYVFGIFEENNLSYDINFLNLLKESESTTKDKIIDFIHEVGSHYNDNYYKILNSDIFNKLSSTTIELALNKISEVHNQDEDIRIEKIDFIMSCIVLNDKKFVLDSLDFIEKDEDIKLVSTKINCVKNIIPHIYINEVSTDQYNKYLEVLSEGLNGKTVDEQIDMLEAKMNFFEKMDAYKDVDKLSKNLISLLNRDNNRNDIIHNFIYKTTDGYIKDRIDEKLSLLDKDDKEMYVNFVMDEFFDSVDKKRKETLLRLFDKNTIKIGFEENEEKLIEVSPYVYSIVENNEEPLKFVNDKTGLKIFVKQIKKS